MPEVCELIQKETDNLSNAKQNALSNNSSGVGEVLLSGSTLKK